MQYSPDTQYTPSRLTHSLTHSLSFALSLIFLSLSIIILDYLLVFSCSRHNCFISSFSFLSLFFLSFFLFFFLSGCSPLSVTLLRLLPYYYPTPTTPPSSFFLSLSLSLSFIILLLLLPSGLFCVVCFPLTTRLC